MTHANNVQSNNTNCANCHIRPGTVIFTSGGALDYSHGLYAMWCRRCVLEAQIKHAEERAADLPKLRSQLAGLTD